MKELKKKLSEYTVKVTPVAAEDGGGFKAIYEELALSVKGYGHTLAEAVADLEEIALDVLADEPLNDFPAPRQEAPWAEYSGRVTLRLPKMLHAQLDRLADEQGVSLNQLMTHALQSAATTMLAGQEFGSCARIDVNDLTETLTSLRGYMDVWSVSSTTTQGKAESMFHGVPLRKQLKLNYTSMETLSA